jgi:hypothetical protein
MSNVNVNNEGNTVSGVINNVEEVSSHNLNCPEDAAQYFMQLNAYPELTLSDNQPENYYLAKEGLFGIDRAGEPRLIMAGYIIPVGLAADKSQCSGLSVVFIAKQQTAR